MKIERTLMRVLGILLVLISFLSFEAEAQRRKKKSSVSSATKLREAEYYFTEAEKYFILEDYAKALALFQQSLEIDPANSAAYYKKAQIEFKNEELDKAIKNIDMALEIDPMNKYYHLLSIEILTQKGDFENATESYEKLISTIPGTEHYLYEVAAIYLFQERFDDALKTFERLELKFGSSEEISLQRHRVYNQMGKKKEALDELIGIVKAYPLSEDYNLSLAEYYLSLDRTKDAITVLEKMIELFPLNARASLLLGEIYRKEKDFEKASPYLRNAYENTELNVDLKVQLIAQYNTLPSSESLDQLILGLCNTLVKTHSTESNAYAIYGDFLLSKDQNQEASEQYKKSLDLDESNFVIWQNLLLIYSRMNDHDNVILTADKALVLFPNQSILYYLSGYASLRKQLYQESIYLLKSGKRLAGNNKDLTADYNGLLGEAYNATKDYPNSDKAFEEALETHPDNWIVLNNYSYFLAIRNEKLDEAEKMAARLIKGNPENITFLDTYAYVLYARKKYREARKIAEKAVDSGKAKAVHYEHYGDILFKLGDVDGAVLQWQKAKGLDSTLELIDKKIADRKLYEK